MSLYDLVISLRYVVTLTEGDAAEVYVGQAVLVEDCSEDDEQAASVRLPTRTPYRLYWLHVNAGSWASPMVEVPAAMVLGIGPTKVEALTDARDRMSLETLRLQRRLTKLNTGLQKANLPT